MDKIFDYINAAAEAIEKKAEHELHMAKATGVLCPKGFERIAWKLEKLDCMIKAVVSYKANIDRNGHHDDGDEPVRFG